MCFKKQIQEATKFGADRYRNMECHILKCTLDDPLSTFRPRPKSLERLLASIEATDFGFAEDNPGWEILLEVRVDGGGGEEGRKVEQVASNFEFTHGDKVSEHQCTLFNF